MVYAYLRVSTDKQEVENQEFGILKYAKSRNLKVAAFIKDVVSGTKDWRKRELGVVMKNAKAGDTIIFPEVSRIARSTLQCLEVLKLAADKKVQVHAAKENIVFDNSINSTIIATTLSLVAEIERAFISMRTKEGLARAKAAGKILGRPKGSTSVNAQMAAHHTQVVELLEKQIAPASIAKMLGLDPRTVRTYIKKHLPQFVKIRKSARKQGGKKVMV